MATLFHPVNKDDYEDDACFDQGVFADHLSQRFTQHFNTKDARFVKSGLVDDPHVSQYRLTAHLVLAVFIYGYMLWVAWGLLFANTDTQANLTRLKWFAYGLVALIVVTIASGGFVAGLKAGLAFNTFPLMGDRWIPDGIFALQPWPINLFENIATVQFDHRVLALLTFISIVVLWSAAKRVHLCARLNYALHGLLAMGVAQLALGISTLLLYVPVALACAHQTGALILFTLALFVAHQLHTQGVSASRASVFVER